MDAFRQRSPFSKLSVVHLLFLLLLNNNLQSSTTNAQEQPNPPCYVCFDGGASTVTRPDVVIPLPPEAVELTPGGGFTEASCALIQQVAEQMRLVPADLCPALDRNDLKLACGCANAVPTGAPAGTGDGGGDGAAGAEPTTQPVAAPVPVVPVNPPVAPPPQQQPENPAPEPAPVAADPPTIAPDAEPPTAAATRTPTADPPTAPTKPTADAPTADPPTGAAPTTDPPTSAVEPPTPDAAAPAAAPSAAPATPTPTTMTTTTTTGAPVAASSGTRSPVVVTTVTSPVAGPPPTLAPVKQPGQYPACYICFDGGASTITNPEFPVPLPEDVTAAIGYTRATCEDIRRIGEDELLIPELACLLVDREDLRAACGCTNALADNNNDNNNTNIASPSQAPVPPRTPTNPTCPFQEQTDLCPLNMFTLAAQKDVDRQCECYNFCNGQFVGCCSAAGEACEVNCILEGGGDSEGRVTGCRDSDRPLEGTDLTDLTESSGAAGVGGGAALSWSVLALSFGAILHQLLLLIF